MSKNNCPRRCHIRLTLHSISNSTAARKHNVTCLFLWGMFVLVVGLSDVCVRVVILEFQVLCDFRLESHNRDERKRFNRRELVGCDKGTGVYFGAHATARRRHSLQQRMTNDGQVD